MAGPKTFFFCTQCGYKSTKWLGRCPDCSAWNTFIEETEQVRDKPGKTVNAHPQPLNSVMVESSDRIMTGLSEFDRVTGGLLPGQAVLLSGEPGIGKSTLLLKTAQFLSARGQVIYVNGEESASQVKHRAERMGVSSDAIFLLGENDPEVLGSFILKEKPAFLIVDSLQTLQSSRYTSQPGSMVQMREGAFTLVQAAKASGTVLILVGHITKSGTIAGPKIVEHLVDTVFYFESDVRAYFRILRSLKNRFYTTDEIGLFTMTSTGLEPLSDSQNAFLQGYDQTASGVTLYPMLEGSRVFPVEIQALVTPSQFNYPRRTAEGMDNNRLSLLVAIMEKVMRLQLASHDIYVNVTSGLRIDDPALDLAVIFAIYSSFKDLIIPLNTAFFGEVGLTGEVRTVLKPEKRQQELARLGFNTLFYPYHRTQGSLLPGVSMNPVKSLSEALALLPL